MPVITQVILRSCREDSEPIPVVKGSSCLSPRRFFHRGNEPVAATRQSLYMAGLLGIIFQCLAQFLNRRIDTVFKVYKGIDRPESAPKFFSGDHFSRLVEEDG